jgi:hypothetical protein
MGFEFADWGTIYRAPTFLATRARRLGGGG